MRNLVLLLSSGHTVRIALRDDDLTGNGGPTHVDVHDFLTMLPAVVVGGPEPKWTFAYVEDPTHPGFREGSIDPMPPGDFQRIAVENVTVQYG